MTSRNDKDKFAAFCTILIISATFFFGGTIFWLCRSRSVTEQRDTIDQQSVNECSECDGRVREFAGEIRVGLGNVQNTIREIKNGLASSSTEIRDIAKRLYIIAERVAEMEDTLLHLGGSVDKFISSLDRTVINNSKLNEEL